MRAILTPLTFYLIACSLGLGAAAESVAAVAYTPIVQVCPPGTSLVRQTGSSAQSLSAGEAAYVSGRQQVALNAWKGYLANVQAYLNTSQSNASLPQYVDDILSGLFGVGPQPRLGIATSGGGYRSAIFGAGILNALDGRNQTSVEAGTGGVLQAATYLSGLSGGSWLVSSLAQADFPMLPELIFGSSPSQTNDGNAKFGGWLADMDLLTPGGANIIRDAEYLVDIVDEVSGKFSAGFPVTVTDVWARALSRHFANGTTAANFFDDNLPHGAGITFSSIVNVSSFVNHEQPFPIVVADSLVSRTNGSAVTEDGDLVPLTNPIYEFNPFEMGTYDPQLGAFTPMRFLGSPPTNRSTCVTGFDQLAYIAGTSSNVFNGPNVTSAVLSIIDKIVNFLEEMFTQTDVRLDSAAVPNAFFGVSPATFPDSDQTVLTLVDGGEDGETDPLQPLLVLARGVDTIIAIDAPADTSDNFAAGLDLISTQARVQLFPGTYFFPPVPNTTDVYLSQNLTRRPTFFGCNSSAASDEPFVIYIANGGPPLGQAPVTNTPTFQLEYSNGELGAMLDQTFDIATQGIPSETPGGPEKDPDWPACLACAITDRARRTIVASRSGICETCMARYCWS
ncbi:lysophospholipase [Dichomitus squalens]|uniref:Lysophospholipase n=1 Tax=Dichomitus squalens TaxID=114155 RepID=A0A4Q9MRJ4_9APHY|nr:lysophospholipase [Dichomitus squalens]